MDTTVLLPFLLVAVLVLALVLLARSARIVNQYEKGIVMRLGKFYGLAPSGLAIIMPLTDSIIRVDMREQVISVPPQKLITKDNVTVEVDAVVYYKVVDPVKSQFEVQDFGYACTTLAQTNLRNLIGDRTLDETLVARDMINTNLRLVLDEATNGLGCEGHPRGSPEDRSAEGYYGSDVPPDESGARQARSGAGSRRFQAKPDFAG